MKVVVLTKEGMDYSRDVSDFLSEFERRTGKELEVLDPETREGESFARVYDVVEYPAIVAIEEDGREIMSWRGPELPTINEVSYYSGA